MSRDELVTASRRHTGNRIRRVTESSGQAAVASPLGSNNFALDSIARRACRQSGQSRPLGSRPRPTQPLQTRTCAWSATRRSRMVSLSDAFIRGRTR
jgi:hypothetical protein